MSKDYFPERKGQYDQYVADHELTEEEQKTLKWLMSTTPNKYWNHVNKFLFPEHKHNERGAGRHVSPVNPNITLADIDEMFEYMTMDQIAAHYNLSKPALYRQMRKLGREFNGRRRK